MSTGAAVVRNLLNEKQTAAFLGVSEGTLKVWRSVKRYNLPYIKVGKCVRYRYEHVLKFLASRTKPGGSTPKKNPKPRRRKAVRR